RHLPEGLWGGAGAATRAGAVLPVLQRGALPPGVGLPDAGAGLPGQPAAGRLRGVAGRRGAFFFRPPRTLSPGEGSAAGGKRMPWDRARRSRRGRAEFSGTVAKESTFLVWTMGSTLLWCQLVVIGQPPTTGFIGARTKGKLGRNFI